MGKQSLSLLKKSGACSIWILFRIYVQFLVFFTGALISFINISFGDLFTICNAIKTTIYFTELRIYRSIIKFFRSYISYFDYPLFFITWGKRLLDKKKLTLTPAHLNFVTIHINLFILIEKVIMKMKLCRHVNNWHSLGYKYSQHLPRLFIAVSYWRRAQVMTQLHSTTELHSWILMLISLWMKQNCKYYSIDISETFSTLFLSQKKRIRERKEKGQ